MEFPSSRLILRHRNPNPKGARSLSLHPQTKLRQSSSLMKTDSTGRQQRNRTKRAVAAPRAFGPGPCRHAACPVGTLPVPSARCLLSWVHPRVRGH